MDRGGGGEGRSGDGVGEERGGGGGVALSAVVLQAKLPGRGGDEGLLKTEPDISQAFCCSDKGLVGSEM